MTEAEAQAKVDLEQRILNIPLEIQQHIRSLEETILAHKIFIGAGTVIGFILGQLVMRFLHV